MAQSGNFSVMVLVPFWHCRKASQSLVLQGWNEPTPLRAECHFGPRCATGNSACLDTRSEVPRPGHAKRTCALPWAPAG